MICKGIGMMIVMAGAGVGCMDGIEVRLLGVTFADMVQTGLMIMLPEIGLLGGI
jgi:hypothetical protein